MSQMPTLMAGFMCQLDWAKGCSDSSMQRSPTILVPGTDFAEDSFSTAGGRGGGGTVQAVMRAMGRRK